MPRLSMWKPNKTNDYKFIDRVIREQFHVGGTGVIIHKYIGPQEGPVLDDPTQTDYQNDGMINETTIQDLLFLENRDRKYDQDLYELRGVYNVSDNDFDLTQFGLFLTNDTLYMTFHMNEMVETLGRKLMSGDVLELPHLIELYSLDANSPPIPKFYTVTDGNRGGEGFSATWWPHLWRVKLEPITASQEFDDILGRADEEDSMKNIFSTFAAELDIRDAIVDSAAITDPVVGLLSSYRTCITTWICKATSGLLARLYHKAISSHPAPTRVTSLSARTSSPIACSCIVTPSGFACMTTLMIALGATEHSTLQHS